MRRTWHERLEVKSANLRKKVKQVGSSSQYINKTEEEALFLEDKLMQVPGDKYRQILLEKKRMIRDCWIWTGKQEHGYGTLWIPEIKYTARVHVLSLFLFRRKAFSFKKQVNHTCNVKSCFNPNHLYAGTQTQNMADYRDFLKNQLEKGIQLYPRIEI